MRFGRVPAPFILFYCQVKSQRWRDRRRARNWAPNGHRREKTRRNLRENWRNRLIRGWPGAESNHRHADFQSATFCTREHLIQPVTRKRTLGRCSRVPLGYVGLETEVETAAAPLGLRETACVQRDGSANDSSA